MAEDLNLARVRNTLDYLDIKVSALNRGFIMILNALQSKGMLDNNSITWIDKIKRDPALAKKIDAERLMDLVLDIMSKVPCPESGDEAIKLVRNHVVKPQVQKVKLPKL